MKPLFSRQKIHVAVCNLGMRVEDDFGGKFPLLVGVLKGSFVFIADLSREIDIAHEVDFIRASGGVVTGDMSISAQGRHLIVVEDIVDVGVTIVELDQYLRKFKPASIAYCALLKRSTCMVPIRYVGLEVDEGFVVGYGMDHAEKYRGLPDLWTLDSEPSV